MAKELTEKQVQRILNNQIDDAIEKLAKYVENGGDIRVATSILKREVKTIMKGELIYPLR